MKALLGFCPTRKPKKPVEISDEFGFSKVYESLTQAARDCRISNPSAMKYALDNGKSEIKRRSDKKILYSRINKLLIFLYYYIKWDTSLKKICQKNITKKNDKITGKNINLDKISLGNPEKKDFVKI